MQLPEARVWMRTYRLIGSLLDGDDDSATGAVERRYKYLVQLLGFVSLREWDEIIREARVVMLAAGE